ncbi:hypothetical protein V1477_009395 [Vespula maculifrons]|uniref:Uncharacterized protein n=1 Tax=Vespula maculifrons TaxID=7453 RepID=A0ABD2C9N5_VESMC
MVRQSSTSCRSGDTRRGLACFKIRAIKYRKFVGDYILFVIITFIVNSITLRGHYLKINLCSSVHRVSRYLSDKKGTKIEGDEKNKMMKKHKL